MIDRLVHLLRFAGLEFGDQELLDSLWLARHMPTEPAPVSTPSGPTSATTPVTKEQKLQLTSGEAACNEQDATTPGSSGMSPDGSLVAAGPGASDCEPLVSATGVRIPAGTALPEGLDIVRALRILPRRAPSRTVRILDEEATVEATASGSGRITPVFRPAPERWFEAALVIEQTPSMDIWAQTVLEIERLLQYVGAFRDVRTWRLHMGDQPYLTRGSDLKTPVNSLRDPEARRIIFLFSHGVSTAWIEGGLGKIIAGWNGTNPVVLIHALPQRLWKDTPLGEPTGVARNAAPGGSNTGLQISRAWWTRAGSHNLPRAALPVMSLDGASARQWAEMVMSRKGRSAPAFLVRTVPSGTASFPISERKLTPEENVSQFQANSSPEAFRLAVHLASGTITIPVIHLLQSALFGATARHATVAEVMLSGLVQRVTPVGGAIPPERVQFRFDPAVKRILLRSLRVEDARRMCELVQNYIEQQFGSPNDFLTWLRDPKGTASIPASAEPFVQLRAGFLEYLGLSRLPVKSKQAPAVHSEVYVASSDQQFANLVRDAGVPEANIFKADWIPKDLSNLRGKLLLVWIRDEEFMEAHLDILPDVISNLRFYRQLIFLNTSAFPGGFQQLPSPRILTNPRPGVQHMLRTEARSEPLWPVVEQIFKDDPQLLFNDPDAFCARVTAAHSAFNLDRREWSAKALQSRKFYFDGDPASSEFDQGLMDRLESAGLRLVYDLDSAEVSVTTRDSDEQFGGGSLRGLPVVRVGLQGSNLGDQAVTFTDDWDESFERLLDRIEAACNRPGELHRVPHLPEYFVPRPYLNEKILEAFGRAVVITGKGKRTACAAFARDDGTRARFPGGIYWETKPPITGMPTLRILPWSEHMVLPKNESWLLYQRGTKPVEDWPIVAIPPFTMEEADTLLSSVANRPCGHLWPLHGGDLTLTDYLIQMFTSLNKENFFIAIERDLPGLSMLIVADGVSALTLNVVLPTLEGYARECIRMLSLAYQGEMPVELTDYLDMKSYSIQNLELAESSREGYLSLNPLIVDELESEEFNRPQLHAKILDSAAKANGEAVNRYYRQSMIFHLIRAGNFRAATITTLSFDWMVQRAQLDGSSAILSDLEQLESHDSRAALVAAKLRSYGSRSQKVEGPAESL
ncbi:MAG: hypothetical protein H7Y20_08835, partial [Bryobacteraceae bacterium]|nr:hypothetical protein [Bryobacteraceae bacterium]